MRLGLMILLAVTTAAPAAGASKTAFLKLCEVKVPVATCGCIANELLRTRNGQLALDAYEASQRPAAERTAAVKEVLDKYGLKLSEARAMVEAGKAQFESLIPGCM